jgi:hypothetical protein
MSQYRSKNINLFHYCGTNFEVFAGNITYNGEELELKEKSQMFFS